MPSAFDSPHRRQRWKEEMESDLEGNWPARPSYRPKSYFNGNDFVSGFERRTSYFSSALSYSYKNRKVLENNSDTTGNHFPSEFVRTTSYHSTRYGNKDRKVLENKSNTTGNHLPSEFERTTSYHSTRHVYKNHKVLENKSDTTGNHFKSGFQERTTELYYSTKFNSLSNANSSPSRNSKPQWKEIDQKSQEEQKHFLEKYKNEGKFRDVAFSKREGNVKRGDHLLQQGLGGLYDHHFLCIKVDGDEIEIIEYTGPEFGLSAASKSVASSNPLAFAAIKTKKMSFQELENNKVKIRIWPQELQRFTCDERVARAKKRLWEMLYDGLENNCEHFVNWCICGLNVSLQVKSGYKQAWDGVKAVASSVVEGAKNYGLKNATPILLKAAGNLSDDVLGAFSSSLSPIGFGIGAMIETGLAAWNISKDYQKMKKGLLNERQFKINTVTTISKGAGRTVGGYAGMVVGSALGPAGSIIGGAIGCGLGHLAGSAIGWCYERFPKVMEKFEEKVVAPVKRCINTIVSGVKKTWEKCKSFFSSLFSW